MEELNCVIGDYQIGYDDRNELSFIIFLTHNKGNGFYVFPLSNYCIKLFLKVTECKDIKDIVGKYIRIQRDNHKDNFIPILKRIYHIIKDDWFATDELFWINK